MEKLVIAGREFSSRLFLGTGKFDSNALMAKAIEASGTEMVTVAMKRVELEDKEDDLLTHVVRPGIQLLPNTSGVRNAEEAVFAAQMAREAFGTNWLKLEIHPDPRYLLPDSTETLKATEELVKLGFVVLPYCQADPTLCKHLEEAGAATVMPLGAPIGTNKGLQTRDFLTQPCRRGDGDGRVSLLGEHGDCRGGRPRGDGCGFQAGRGGRLDGLRGRVGLAGRKHGGGSQLAADCIFERINRGGAKCFQKN